MRLSGCGLELHGAYKVAVLARLVVAVRVPPREVHVLPPLDAGLPLQLAEALARAVGDRGAWVEVDRVGVLAALDAASGGVWQ